MDKLVYVKEIRAGNKNGKSWPIVVDQDGTYWPIFAPLPVPQVGKCYLFTFKHNAERGWNELELIKPLVNVFQQKALKEVANRNDFVRMYSMAFSYSKDLASSGKIELTEMFDWSDKIYGYFQERADKEMAKLEKPDA